MDPLPKSTRLKYEINLQAMLEISTSIQLVTSIWRDNPTIMVPSCTTVRMLLPKIDLR